VFGLMEEFVRKQVGTVEGNRYTSRPVNWETGGSGQMLPGRQPSVVCPLSLCGYGRNYWP